MLFKLHECERRTRCVRLSRFEPQGAVPSSGRPGNGAARRGEWLPTDADELYIKSLMQPVFERGKMAAWIAPPLKGINGLPNDFEYVRQ